MGRIESSAIPVLRKLVGGETPNELSDDDRWFLAFFIGMMSVRVPGFRDSIKGFMGELMRKVALMGAHHPEYFERTLREAMKSAGKETPEDIEAVRKFVLSGEYDVVADPILSLQTLVQMSPTVAQYAFDFRWRVLRAETGTNFVPSDRPVVLISSTRMPGLGKARAGPRLGWKQRCRLHRTPAS